MKTSLSLAVFSILFAISATSIAEPNKSHIAVLAASCAACHGTQGNSVNITPSLAGLSADYFTTQMLGFKDGSRKSTVMHRHAKGLTPEEIDALAIYFSQQKRGSSSRLKPETLKAHHGN